MRIAYLHCATGISGDMTLAALIDAGVDEQRIREAVGSLNLPGVELAVEQVVKGGFRSRHVRVNHPEQHAHRHYGDIEQIVNSAGGLSPAQKTLALRMFRAVAEAEAHVHGSTVEQVHFHEVGAIDSIVDIVGVAVGFDLLSVDQVVCSPIPTGRGQVHIAHGVCPIPAPGTAELLKGIPLTDVPIEAELTTPTGAAIVKTLVGRYGPMPPMTVEAIGYGAGTMDFAERANVLRIFVGKATIAGETDQICLLETNLDDIASEVIGYACEKLFAAGALDVYTTCIQMKKERPGVLLSVIANPADADALEAILFTETGTFGVRRQLIERSKRQRRAHSVPTPWGLLQGKLGWRRGAPAIFTPEFDDCARVARNHGIPLRVVYQLALSSYAAKPVSVDELERMVEADAAADAAVTQAVAPSDHSYDHGHSHDHDHSHDHSHDHHHH